MAAVDVEVHVDEPGEERFGALGSLESRLDMVLAEEVAVDEAFARWLLQEAGTWRQRPEMAEAPVEFVRVGINVDQFGLDIPADCHGESDIDLELFFRGGARTRVLIEDKIKAPFMPRQAGRYVGRAEAYGGVALLVAPDRYLAAHLHERSVFHGFVSVESIIEWLGDRASHDKRRQWRVFLLSRLLEVSVKRGIDHAPTIEFTNFCLKWFGENAPNVIANPNSLHTINQGWLEFHEPVGLMYKVEGWSKKRTAAVDLYLKHQNFAGTRDELEAALQGIELPDGFSIDIDTTNPPNLVLRAACAKLAPRNGPPAPGPDRIALIGALVSCAQIADWLTTNSDRLWTPLRPGTSS